MGPVVEFANTGEREQGKPPLSSHSALIHGRADSGALHSAERVCARFFPPSPISLDLI
jgi:hypothetical protein